MEYYFCPYCGTKNFAKAKFCNECGKALPILGDFEKKESSPDTVEQIEISEQNNKEEKASSKIVQNEVLSEMEHAETETSSAYTVAAPATGIIVNNTNRRRFSKHKTIPLVAAALIVIGIIVVIAVLPQRRQLNAEYQQAIKQYENEEYLDAAEYFIKHQDYKQSKEYFNKCKKHFAKDIDPTIDNLKMISEALDDYDLDGDGGTVHVSNKLNSNLSSLKMMGTNGTIHFIPVDDDSDAEISCIWQANYYLDDKEQEKFRQLLSIALEEEPQIVRDGDDVIYVWENKKTNLQIMECPSASGELSVVIFDLDHKVDISDNDEDEMIEPSMSSSVGKSNTSSSVSSTSGSGTTRSHTCEECSKPGVYSIQGISGQTEYYCAEHYEQLKELQDYLYGDN